VTSMSAWTRNRTNTPARLRSPHYQVRTKFHDTRLFADGRMQLSAAAKGTQPTASAERLESWPSRAGTSYQHPPKDSRSGQSRAGTTYPLHPRLTTHNASKPRFKLLSNAVGPKRLRTIHREGVASCAVGLPIFRSPHLIEGAWRTYFLRVYGEVPEHESEYPICVGADLSFLYAGLLKELNITLPKLDVCAKPPALSQVPAREPPWAVKLVTRAHRQQPYPNSSWIEVMHRGRNSGRWELNGMWFGITSGTGVWLNAGRTIAFEGHGDAFQWFKTTARGFQENDLALKARKAGYDTIQFLRCDGIMDACCRRLNLGACCGGFEIMTTYSHGRSACGSVAMFRAGWNASRPCACSEKIRGSTMDAGDPVAGYLNCQGYASG